MKGAHPSKSRNRADQNRSFQSVDRDIEAVLVDVLIDWLGIVQVVRRHTLMPEAIVRQNNRQPPPGRLRLLHLGLLIVFLVVS